MDSIAHIRNPFLRGILYISAVLERLSRNVLLIFMIAMGSLVAANVFSRYFLGFSLTWSYELSIHSFMYTVYLGTALSIKERSHARTDIIYSKVKGPIKGAFLVINYGALFILMIYVFTYYGIMEVMDKWRTTALMFDYSMGIIFFAVPFCGITSVFYLFDILIRAKYSQDKGDDDRWW